MGNKEITLKIKGDSKSAQTAFDKASAKAKDFAGKLDSNPVSKMTKSVGQLTAGFGAYAAAAKAVVGTINDLTEAYEKQAKAEIQLEVASKNNPYLSASSVDRLKDYASHLQSIGTVGDEDLMPVMAKLAAAGRTEAEIQDIMSAALDMSAGGMISLESAADGLSKTLDGQAGALGKVIPSVKTLTTEQLKNGDAIRQAADAYAGMSEEVTKATGSTQQLKNAWGDFKENLGEGFSKIITPIKNMFTGLLTGVNNAVAGAKNAVNQIKTINDYRSGKLNPNELDSGSLGKIFEQAKYDYAASVTAAKGLKETFAQQILTYGADYLQDITELEFHGGKGLDAFQNAMDAIAYGNKMPTLLSELDQAIKNKTATQNQVQMAEALHNMITSYEERSKTQIEYQGALAKEAAAVEKANQEAWTAEVKEAKNKADAAIMAAKTLNDLKKADGLLSPEGYNDAMYNAVWSAYETMVTASTDPSKMQKEGLAQAIHDMLAQYSDRTEKDVKYTANRSSAKEEAPKELSDWIADIVNEVVRAREKQDAEAKLSGKSLSTQDKQDARADAAYSAIVKVLSDKNFMAEQGAAGKDQLLSDETIRGYLDDIAKSTQWKEFTEGKQDLASAMKEFWNEAGQHSVEELESAENLIRDSYEKVKSVHVLTEREQKEFNDKMKELDDELHSADTPEKVADVENRILALQTQYHQLSISEEEEYAETMNRLRDELAKAESQRLKDLVAERVSMGDQLVQGLGDSARQAGDMTKEYFENSRQADIAEQQKLYEDGAISYEEYCDRVNKIDREAAQAQYRIAMAQWVIELAQATSNIALGVTKAIAEGYPMGLINGALVSAAGAVSIASIIANKPRPPSFETGGIVPGTSYTGDRVGVRVNSGEGIFTRDQMKAMGIMARTGTQQAPTQNVIVNNNAGRYAEASAEVDQNTVRVTVAEIMHSELRAGNMTGDIQEAQAKARGARYL